jgi:hypothetical protein
MQNTGVNPTNAFGWILLLGHIAVHNQRLRVINRRSTAPIVGDAEVAVSLTSHGKRIQNVWKTIETIGNGTVKPKRVILWLDDTNTVSDPPATLRRLQTRGLELRHCHDYGPHKKYYPYVSELFPDEPNRPLVTADDDVYYPSTWLEELLAAHRPDEVTAFRARIRLDGPYGSWPMCTTTEAVDRVFATGVSGVAYPPRLLQTLRDRGTEFTRICPRADDYWLHFAAGAVGIPIRQVRSAAADWWPMPVASNRGLWDGDGRANDAIVEQTRRAWLQGQTPISTDC